MKKGFSKEGAIIYLTRGAIGMGGILKRTVTI